jgi:hypothetical protein
MKRSLLLVTALFLVGNGAVLLMYRGVVRGSHLFVTAGTLLSPLAACDFILGFICFGVFVLDIIRGRKMH